MLTELKRKVSIVSITEQGLYHEGSLPPDYDGAFLNVEVVHAIMFVDETGGLQTLLCAAPVIKDGAGQVVPYKVADMKLIEAPVGEKSYAEAGVTAYTHFLPEDIKNRANSKIESIKTITGNKVIPI